MMKFKSTIGILVGLIKMLLIAQLAEAYCIYNYSKMKADVRQRQYNTNGDEGSLFSKSIGSNSSECCPLDQITCSKSGNPEEELRVNIVVSNVRYGINLPAGGWVNIVDWADGWIDFNAFQKDGTEFKYQTFEISVVGY